jgi:hypothetical protein
MRNALPPLSNQFAPNFSTALRRFEFARLPNCSRLDSRGILITELPFGELHHRSDDLRIVIAARLS